MRVNSIEELCNLKDMNFNNPQTIRKFELSNISQVEFLIRNYLDDFAFAIGLNNKNYSLIKNQDEIKVRDNSKYKFEFPKCPPSVYNVYCLKTNNINDALKYCI